jgi:uncharacterized membrane protein (TIGR02234 family)
MAEPAQATGPGAPVGAARARGRQLGLVAVLAVAGAAIAAIAAALTWWSADYQDPLTGPLTITVTGGGAVPELVPLALVALAGFGAALSTHGTVRRLVGVVLVLCGGAMVIRSALYFGDQPNALSSSLSRPAAAVGDPQLHALGPALGVLGGLLLAAAGVLIAAGRGARQRLGTRYDAPTGKSTAGPTSAGAVVGAPPDQQDWWKALDAGADPTAMADPDNPDRSEPGFSDPTVKPDS